ncbi:MAG: glycosyltransferase family 39 protein [Bacteroidota bacterium]
MPDRRVLSVCLLAVSLRIIGIVASADLHSDYYWEYGEIAKNLAEGRGYSLWYFTNDALDHHFDPAYRAFPSAYMPPGYVFFLFPFILIKDIVVRNLLLLAVQILVSLASILLVWSVTRKLFSEQSALIAALLVAVLPEFVYATLSFTPTVVYHCFVLCLLLVLVEERILGEFRSTIAAAFLIALLVMLRSEFLLVGIACAILLFIQKKKVKSAAIVGAMALVILPWLIRNEAVFGEFIPGTTNFGLNLYRGSNEVAIGSWGEESTIPEIRQLPRGDRFELNMNEMYFRRTLEYMKAHPFGVLQGFFLKAWDLWVVNLHDPSGRSLSPILIVVSVVLFGTFLLGFVLSPPRGRNAYFILFFVCSTLIAMVFFVMPRYQTMMRIAMIPFSAHGIEVLWGWVKKVGDRR